MKFIIAFLLLLPPYTWAAGSYLQESAALEKDILNGKMNERVMKTADAIISVASVELIKKGYKDKGERLMFEWHEVNRGMLYDFVYAKRDIGDHPNQVLSQWLDEKITMLEFILGIDFCKASHISDLKVINATPRIVFRPCSFDMDSVQGDRIDEYRRHFSRGAVYYGLVPVLSYWGVYGGCLAATAGTGYVFACGLVGGLAEGLMGNFVTDRLSNKIYKMSCGKTSTPKASVSDLP